MKSFKENHIEKIILGCTHYPIYEKMIKEELGYDVELINTGVTVSEYVKKFLEQNNLSNTDTKGEESIYLTKPEKEFKNIAQNIMKIDIQIKQI